MDISGSMAGSKWRRVKKAVLLILNDLKPTDLFGIVLFNTNIKMITGAQG